VIEALHFLVPDLRAIDEASAELIACAIFADERPMRGLAGLLDWRLGARLSALAKSDFLRGDEGEVVLVPGRPKLPFEKVLLLGLGPRAAFGDAVVRRVLGRLITTLDGLKVKRALVEIPGRASGELEPERAAELLLECAEPALTHEMWTLVDTSDAEEPMARKLVRRRDAGYRTGA
jgi:hypothetical protein